MAAVSRKIFPLIALAGLVLLGCTTESPAPGPPSDATDEVAQQPVAPLDGQEPGDAADTDAGVDVDMDADAGADTDAGTGAGTDLDGDDDLDADDDAAAPADEAEEVAALTALLADHSPEVRARAARDLGRLGEAAKAAAPQLTALLADEEPAVRRQAVLAIGAIQPGPEVMVPLFVQLMEDSDPGVRLRVLGAIADVGEAAVPRMIEALKNDQVAYWACIVLRDIGPAAKDAVPALTEKLEDPRPEIRLQAVLALGAMDGAALPAVPQIASLVGDEHAGTAATFVLGQLGSIPADAEQAIRAHTKSDNRFLSTVSLWALARVHPDDVEIRREATEQLIARLMDEDAYVRVIAARALAALPPAPEITVPIWEEAMKEADPTTVRHALDALASLGAPAVPRLVDILAKYPPLRAEIAYALGQMGPEAAGAVEALAGLITDEDMHVATEAILALGKIGPDAASAVPALTAALQEAEEKNAHAIIYTLGNIGPAAAPAEPLVLAAMESEDKSLAVIAARSYLEIQDSASPEAVAKAVEVFAGALSDALPETRKAAADNLGDLGPAAAEALPALRQAAKDDVKAVRDAIERAIKSIGG